MWNNKSGYLNFKGDAKKFPCYWIIILRRNYNFSLENICLLKEYSFIVQTIQSNTIPDSWEVLENVV